MYLQKNQKYIVTKKKGEKTSSKTKKINYTNWFILLFLGKQTNLYKWPKLRKIGATLTIPTHFKLSWGDAFLCRYKPRSYLVPFKSVRWSLIVGSAKLPGTVLGSFWKLSVGFFWACYVHFLHFFSFICHFIILLLSLLFFLFFKYKNCFPNSILFKICELFPKFVK